MKKPAPEAATATPTEQVLGLASEGWALLTTPATLLGLAAATLAGLGLSLWVSGGGGEVWRMVSGESDPLMARIDALLGLHAPWTAWWMVFLPVATVASAAALLIERSPWWGLRPGGRSELARKKLGALDRERVMAAVARLGGDARLAEGGGRLALLVPSALYRAAVLVLLLGGVVFSVGVVQAVGGTILGEMILVPEQAALQVLVPGKEGQPTRRASPVHLEVNSVAAAGDRAEVTVAGTGQTVELSPTQPLRVGTTWFEPRTTRQADGGDRYRLRLTGPAGKVEEASLVPRESLSHPETGSIYRVRTHTEDFEGAGPAVWIERLVDEKPVEAFWVFEQNPEFDGPNRDDPIAIELLGIERQHELVVGVVHLAGLVPLTLGLALFVLGVLLLQVAVRGSKVIGLEGEEAWGHPAKDAEIGQALEALAGAGKGR
ncbi:MAG: hypothetical protein P1V51_18690 [Deltaproteobacteria bacterium]|nr:hypothetical protein [Deltaproteobacteria bacterium]